MQTGPSEQHQPRAWEPLAAADEGREQSREQRACCTVALFTSHAELSKENILLQSMTKMDCTIKKYDRTKKLQRKIILYFFSHLLSSYTAVGSSKKGDFTKQKNHQTPTFSSYFHQNYLEQKEEQVHH